PLSSSFIRPLSSSPLFPYTPLFRSVLHGGPADPAEIKRAQGRRAQRLLTCTCRGGRCKVPDKPLEGEAYAPIIAGLSAQLEVLEDRKSTRLNSSHQIISYAVFCLKK